jgi:hypothetical protein
MEHPAPTVDTPVFDRSAPHQARVIGRHSRAARGGTRANISYKQLDFPEAVAFAAAPLHVFLSEILHNILF